MSHGFGSTKHPESCIFRNLAATEVGCVDFMLKVLCYFGSSASVLQWNSRLRAGRFSLFKGEGEDDGSRTVLIVSTPHLHPLPLLKGRGEIGTLGVVLQQTEPGRFVPSFQNGCRCHIVTHHALQHSWL